MKKSFLKKTTGKGFTLVELIIVVGIMALISILVLFNSSGLKSSTLLSNTAYEIGLIVRDAQVSGLGARVLSLNGAATTTNQGVHFDLNNPNNSRSIIFFADINNNGIYDQSSDKSQIYQMNDRAGKILSICQINNLTPQGSVCNIAGVPGALQNMTDLNIIFKRPNPEAYFYFTDPGIEAWEGSVVVNIGFEQDRCKSVIIYKTGATQIDSSFCPPNN